MHSWKLSGTVPKYLHKLKIIRKVEKKKNEEKWSGEKICSKGKNIYNYQKQTLKTQPFPLVGLLQTWRWNLGSVVAKRILLQTFR